MRGIKKPLYLITDAILAKDVGLGNEVERGEAE
jgi:hypothetical protein